MWCAWFLLGAICALVPSIALVGFLLSKEGLMEFEQPPAEPPKAPQLLPNVEPTRTIPPLDVSMMAVVWRNKEKAK
jgi:hypothetical protein